MKKIVEIDTKEGLEKFLGQKILLMCGAYFYAGILAGVNETCVLLTNASIVYETGTWDSAEYADAQRLPGESWYVQISAIESFGGGK